MFGHTPEFSDLWHGNESVLRAFYPDTSSLRPFDNSSAELALANRLAWWTGKNPARMERLMTRSNLCQRDKWRNRADYRKRTIEQAISNCKSYMRVDNRKKQQLEQDKKIGNDFTFPIVTDVITADKALEIFVLISSGSYVVDRRTKQVRQYNDVLREYSASLHLIETVKDGKLNKRYIPVVKAWLNDPLRHSVDVLTWDPSEEEFCHALERTQAGERAYNLWAGLQLLPAPPNYLEWAQVFIDHVSYLVPIEAERKKFMQWLAHIFQRPGELPHVCYLMIATTTGIGRGTLGSILTRALRGYVASNMDITALFGGFNGRISQKLLATVDEVREGNGVNKYENQESFKSKSTEEVRSINVKYGAQSVERNCCRWLLFSNHFDALPFDNGDRRIIVIENPTDRRNPADYKHLHNNMNKVEFIASVQHYLLTLDITNFNAHESAPLNSIKQRALKSLESSADTDARQFSENWPEDLATVSDLRNFMGDDAPIHSRNMSYVIERSGMVTAHKRRIGGKLETLLIVRGALTDSDLKNVSNEMLSQRIHAARVSFNSS